MSLSVAVLVTMSVVKSLMVALARGDSDGPLWTPFTTTQKLFVAVNSGFTESNTSLLVTTVVIRLLMPAWFVPGVQVMIPPALMLVPCGELIKAYPIVVAWIFGSVAV